MASQGRPSNYIYAYPPLFIPGPKRKSDPKPTPIPKKRIPAPTAIQIASLNNESRNLNNCIKNIPEIPGDIVAIFFPHNTIAENLKLYKDYIEPASVLWSELTTLYMILKRKKSTGKAKTFGTFNSFRIFLLSYYFRYFELYNQDPDGLPNAYNNRIKPIEMLSETCIISDPTPTPRPKGVPANTRKKQLKNNLERRNSLTLELLLIHAFHLLDRKSDTSANQPSYRNYIFETLQGLKYATNIHPNRPEWHVDKYPNLTSYSVAQFRGLHSVNKQLDHIFTSIKNPKPLDITILLEAISKFDKSWLSTIKGPLVTNGL